MTIEVADLIDAVGVAQLLGLANRSSVSVYQRRYADMPRPVVDLGPGRPRLWSRRAVEAWASSTDRRTPQQVAKEELEELRPLLDGLPFAKSLFRATYAGARQHGRGQGRRSRELAPTRRAAFELALEEARRHDPGFTVALSSGWLDAE